MIGQSKMNESLHPHLSCEELFVFIYVSWHPMRFPYQTMFLSFNSNMMGVTGGTGTANISGAPEFSLVCSAQSLISCVVFCRSLFVLFLLPIVLSILQLMASDYSYVIF